MDETQHKELTELYRTTQDPRVRTRAQMIFLSTEQKMIVTQIAAIVREIEPTVLRWLKRYHAEGANGLCDDPRPTKHYGLGAVNYQTGETVGVKLHSCYKPWWLNVRQAPSM